MRRFPLHNFTALSLRHVIQGTLVVSIISLIGCSAPVPPERNDIDPLIELPIIDTVETAQLRNEKRALVDVPIPPILINDEKKPHVIQTSHFNFTDNLVYQFLSKSLRTHLPAKIPFTKWEPTAFKAEVITYQTYGIDEVTNDVFDQIMLEFAHRTGLNFKRDETGADTNMYFAYVRYLVEAQQLAPTAGKLDRMIENENKRTLEYPLEREQPVRRLDHIRAENGAVVPGRFYLARPIFAKENGNVMAGYFVKDIYQALTNTTIFTRTGTDSIGTSVDGPIYSWRLPFINLMVLSAMYQPNIRSGITRKHAISLILLNIVEDMESGRIVKLESLYKPN